MRIDSVPYSETIPGLIAAEPLSHGAEHRPLRTAACGVAGEGSAGVSRWNASGGAGSVQVGSPVAVRQPGVERHDRADSGSAGLAQTATSWPWPCWSVFERRTSTRRPRPGTGVTSLSCSATISERRSAAPKPSSSMARAPSALLARRPAAGAARRAPPERPGESGGCYGRG